MIVSWDWLSQYVRLDMSRDELTHRLTMSGLNLEGICEVDGDVGIDLEVTSNRPDCLGHIGVAREVAVLFDRERTIPSVRPACVAEKTAAITSVDNECVDLCPQYFARVIRGIQVGPSPDWLAARLKTLGIATINNVVDVTNYVLMEYGQPLHAFDFDKLAEKRIVVRRALAGERLTAINGRVYDLDPEMCVIADAERAVALGGVMGGLETEIGGRTTNVLIETAEFMPLSIRTTARKLSLHSDSSFRFERGVDPLGLDWASLRCCELILELAGGELLDGAVFAGTRPPEQREPITLRFDQIPRILGIDISPEEATRILTALGLKEADEGTKAQRHKETKGLRGKGESADAQSSIVNRQSSITTSASFVPPSWRRDLTREADLIEEVARIHGYENIPEDVPIPVVPTARSLRDRVTETVRETLTAAGFFEAITLSFVSDERCELFTPRGNLPKLRVEHSSRSQENVLRQSLIPSLLVARRENERHGTSNAQLFEIAGVYLPASAVRSDRIHAVGRRERPDESGHYEPQTEAKAEPTMIGLVSSRPFAEMKGVVETLARTANRAAVVTVRPADVPQFVEGRGAEVLLSVGQAFEPAAGKKQAGKPAPQLWGWLGEIDRAVSDKLDLKDAVTVAELDLQVLESATELTPTYSLLPQFPPVARDLNFLLDEAVTWQQLEAVVRDAAGPLLDSISFAGQYRGQQIGVGRKSYVLTITYRSPDRTLTSEEVEEAQAAVIQASEKQLAATLR